MKQLGPVLSELSGYQGHRYKRALGSDMSHSFYDVDFSEELSGPSAKRFKMNNPDTQNNTFLFTSESVGEGHPGKFHCAA